MIVELCRWIDMLILSSFGGGALAGYLNSGDGWCARWFRTTLAGAFLITGSLSFLEQVHQFTDEISWATITLVAFKTSIGSIWLIRRPSIASPWSMWDARPGVSFWKWAKCRPWRAFGSLTRFTCR